MKNISKLYLCDLLGKQEDLSLYIHIPFCSSKCHYCAFYSESKNKWNKEEYLNKYFNKLIEELNFIKEGMNCDTFKTVFIGGGNPGILGPERLERLLKLIGPSDETTFEINPESLSEKYIDIFKKGLANRISVGIQSMDDEILRILGRNASKKDNIKALSILDKISKLKLKREDNYFLSKDIEYHYSSDVEVSIDLMTCLPLQSLEMAQRDIDMVLSQVNLNHLSLYCLTVEEGTYLKEEVIKGDVKVMDEEEQKIHLEKLWSYLNKKGFEHYEISNFCRNGKQCQHNNRYWSLLPYIGIGSAAASTLENEEKLVRLSCSPNFKSYVNSPLITDYEMEVLSKKEQLEEYLLVSLRTKKGMDKKILSDKYNISDADLKKCLIDIDRKYYENKESQFNFTEEGFMMLDSLILDMAINLDKK